MPAIVVGLALARQRTVGFQYRQVLHEIFCNQGLVLMTGDLLIVYWAGGAGVAPVMPFFGS
jgi:hypothetical protein